MNGVRRDSAVRVGTAILLLACGAAYEFWDTTFMADRGYALIHLSFLSIKLTGAIFSDHLARALASAAPAALPAAAVLAAVTYRFLFPAAPTAWHALYTLALFGMALMYWLKRRGLSELQAMVGCLGVVAGLTLEYMTKGVLSKIVLRKKLWILWSGVFLMAGFVVSLIKGGLLRRLRRIMRRINRAAHRMSH